MDIFTSLNTPGINTPTLIEDLAIPIYTSFGNIPSIDISDKISYQSLFIVNNMLYYRNATTSGFSYTNIKTEYSYSSTTASALQSPHMLWGQSFNGTQDIDGGLTASGQIVSTLPQGTSPMVIASSVSVTNLNADLLDGYHASNFSLMTIAYKEDVNFSTLTSPLNVYLGNTKMREYDTFILTSSTTTSIYINIFTDDHTNMVNNKKYIFYISGKECKFKIIKNYSNVSYAYCTEDRWTKITTQYDSTTDKNFIEVVYLDDISNDTNNIYDWDGTTIIGDSVLTDWNKIDYINFIGERDSTLITSTSHFIKDKKYSFYVDFKNNVFREVALGDCVSDIKTLLPYNCNLYKIDLYYNDVMNDKPICDVKEVGMTDLSMITTQDVAIDGVTYSYTSASKSFKLKMVNPSITSYSADKKIFRSIPITSIGDDAFSDCTGLTSVTIPNSVITIGVGAFAGSSDLTSVIIGNSVITIGDSAFDACSGLTSVTIPNSVTSIGDGAFNGCTGLTSIIIPNSVTSIGTWAFSSCKSLKSITIPNSVTSIGEWAFSECKCTGLTSIIIPNSVTSIGSHAFNGCSSLTTITFSSITPPTCGTDIFAYDGSLTTLYVPSISLNVYKTTTNLTSYVSKMIGY